MMILEVPEHKFTAINIHNQSVPLYGVETWGEAEAIALSLNYHSVARVVGELSINNAMKQVGL